MSDMETVREAKRIHRLNCAINSLNTAMADATFTQFTPEFSLLTKRCRNSLGLQLTDAQRLLNDYQIVQEHDKTYLEIPSNYRQFLARVRKSNRVLTIHTQEIKLYLKRFLAEERMQEAF